MSRRIGFLGGTFDPIHKGHIAIASHVRQVLELDEMQLIPNQIPPHKNAAQVSSVMRLKMVEIAAKKAQMSVNSLELQKPEPSYSIYTVQELRKAYPQDQLYFVMGMDSFASLSKWFRWNELLDWVNLVVCQRPSDKMPSEGAEFELWQRHQAVANSQVKAGEIICLQNPNYEISSSQIRSALANKNQLVVQWLEPEVLEFIQQNKFY